MRGLDYSHERFFIYLKGENYSIPPQDGRKRLHTENHEPQTISNFTIRPQGGGEQKGLFGHYRGDKR
jgi:hypothetical protein